MRQKKNDGRPPDTKKELLKPTRTKKEAKKILPTPDVAHNPVKTGVDVPTPETGLDYPSYPWNKMSCWLDVSAQLIYVCVSRNFQDYASGYQGVPNIYGLKSLYQILDKRRLSDLAGKKSSSARRTERDSFRKVLKTKGAISSIDRPESLLERLYFLKICLF